MKKSNILIIVPAYNECENIKSTVEEIAGNDLKVDIVVIDDGSEDDTSTVALESGVPVIPLPFNLGIGGAVQTGFKYAAKNGYDFAVQVDGDGQHDTSYLKTVLEPVMNGQVDMSIGSRFIGPYLGYRSSFIRRIGITFFARLISRLTGCQVTDPTSGFRAYNRKAFAVFSEDYPPDYPEPEAIMVARRYGLKLLEVPVQMRKRRGGHSSIRYLYTLYYMIKVTFAVILCMLKKKKDNKR